MGTGGYKAWRFRKRYYAEYNSHDSYPDWLGSGIAREIPSNREEYKQWLCAQRSIMAEREANLDRYLTFKHAGQRPGEEDEDVRDAKGFIAWAQPIWLAPLNSVPIEWVYIVDLDREVFSVNNGAHFKLDRVPHIDWIGSLAEGRLGDIISLLFGGGDMVGLEVEEAELDSCGFGIPKRLDKTGLDCQVVKPKDITSIPWRRRHGPILRQLVFRRWAESLTASLAATLLQWTPSDLPFREIAFAALCLASGGKRMSVLPEKRLWKTVVYGSISDPEATTPNDPEFVSVLAAGAHLQGKPFGTAPQDTFYWLDGIFVVLVAQLLRPNAVEEGISFIHQYCHDNHINDSIDAVLISIEHIVLVHISAFNKIQHTSILPLFAIPTHLSMPVKDRYSHWYLSGLSQKIHEYRKELDEPEQPFHAWDSFSDFESEDPSLSDPVLYRARTRSLAAESKPESTFYALVHLFESAARRHLRPTRPRVREGRLPNESYAQILTHVTNSHTRNACLEVSRTFRELCQEQYLLNEKLLFSPCETCKALKHKSPSLPECVEIFSMGVQLVMEDVAPEWFHIEELDRGTGARVRFASVGGRKKRQRWRRLDTAVALWVVVVGSEHDRRSLLPGVKFGFLGVESLEESESLG
ncbi:MAG: hypothetical protein Q9195_008560 [Heterodermia aff. obscurata]